MAGLLAYMAAGAAAGAGEGMVEMARKQREDSLLSLKRKWEIDDRNEQRAYNEKIDARDRSQKLADRADERAYDAAWRDEERSYKRGLLDEERSRQDARDKRFGHIVDSLIGSESGGRYARDDFRAEIVIVGGWPVDLHHALIRCA